MNKTTALIIAAFVAGGLGAGVTVWISGAARSAGGGTEPSGNQSPTAGKAGSSVVASGKSPDSDADLEKRVAALEKTLGELESALKAGGNDPRRVAVLEETVKSLQGAMEGVSIEKAAAKREALFAGEEGYRKADEYFEAGKYAIAGEGYLTFVQNNPEHPDVREVMKKSRDAFLRAGYKDKAFWVQEEMMKAFPQHQAADLWEQARLEKDAGLYDRAVEHAARAAELAPNPEERLWKRLYWAWYVQLRDGNTAGIAALQQVQGEIAASGVSNPNLAANAARRMEEWQKLAAGAGGNR